MCARQPALISLALSVSFSLKYTLFLPALSTPPKLVLQLSPEKGDTFSYNVLFG